MGGKSKDTKDKKDKTVKKREVKAAEKVKKSASKGK